MQVSTKLKMQLSTKIVLCYIVCYFSKTKQVTDL